MSMVFGAHKGGAPVWPSYGDDRIRGAQAAEEEEDDDDEEYDDAPVYGVPPRPRMGAMNDAEDEEEEEEEEEAAEEEAAEEERSGDDADVHRNGTAEYQVSDTKQTFRSLRFRNAPQYDPAIDLCPLVTYYEDRVDRPGRMTVVYRRPKGAPIRSNKQLDELFVLGELGTDRARYTLSLQNWQLEFEDNADAEDENGTLLVNTATNIKGKENLPRRKAVPRAAAMPPPEGAGDEDEDHRRHLHTEGTADYEVADTHQMFRGLRFRNAPQFDPSLDLRPLVKYYEENGRVTVEYRHIRGGATVRSDKQLDVLYEDGLLGSDRACYTTKPRVWRLYFEDNEGAVDENGKRLVNSISNLKYPGAGGEETEVEELAAEEQPMGAAGPPAVQAMDVERLRARVAAMEAANDARMNHKNEQIVELTNLERIAREDAAQKTRRIEDLQRILEAEKGHGACETRIQEAERDAQQKGARIEELQLALEEAQENAQDEMKSLHTRIDALRTVAEALRFDAEKGSEAEARAQRAEEDAETLRRAAQRQDERIEELERRLQQQPDAPAGCNLQAFAEQVAELIKKSKVKGAENLARKMMDMVSGAGEDA